MQRHWTMRSRDFSRSDRGPAKIHCRVEFSWNVWNQTEHHGAVDIACKIESIHYGSKIESLHVSFIHCQYGNAMSEQSSARTVTYLLGSVAKIMDDIPCTDIHLLSLLRYRPLFSCSMSFPMELYVLTYHGSKGKPSSWLACHNLLWTSSRAYVVVHHKMM